MNAEIPEQRDAAAGFGPGVQAVAGAAWVGHIMRARNATDVGVVALARILDVDGTPPALRALARAYVEGRLYRADRPRARTGDPETSQEAAESVRGPARPGGTIHKLLDAYDEHRRGPYVGTEHGLTSREVERRTKVRAAHKRTSELLADGLLEVVSFHIGEDGEAVEKVRDGGRVLRITNDGLVELARLNAAKGKRDEAERERAARKLSTRIRWGILTSLRDAPNGLTRQNLEAILGLRGEPLGSWTDGHIGQGLVERAPEKHGGWTVYVLTEKGRRAVARHERHRGE